MDMIPRLVDEGVLEVAAVNDDVIPGPPYEKGNW
jgi:hypothetical protein